MQREPTVRGELRLVEISRWVASAIKTCEGSRTVGEVVSRLAKDLPELDKDVKNYVIASLFAGAHASGFVNASRDARLTTIG